MLSTSFSVLAALCVFAASTDPVAAAEAAEVTTSTHHHKHHGTTTSAATYAGETMTNDQGERFYVVEMDPVDSGTSGTRRKFQHAQAQAVDDNTWDPLDPLLQIGPLAVGDGRDSSYSDTHHILKRDAPHVHVAANPPSRVMGKRHHHHHHHHEHVQNHSSNANTNQDPNASGANVASGDHVHSHVHSHSHNKRSDLGGHGHSRIYGRNHPHKNSPSRITLSGDHQHVHIHQRELPDNDFHFRVGHAYVQGTANKRSEDAQYFVEAPTGMARRVKRDEPVVEQGADAGVASADNGAGTPRGVQGTIDVVVLDTDPPHVAASLVLSAPVNGSANASSPSANSSMPFVLDASNVTSTQFTLAVVKSNESTQDKFVTLRISLFEPDQAAMVDYCVTYDPNPPTPLPLGVQRCLTEELSKSTMSISDAEVHARQVYKYLPTTGVLSLIWYDATAVATGANATAAANAMGSANSTTSNGPSTPDAPSNAPQAPISRRYFGSKHAMDNNPADSTSSSNSSTNATSHSDANVVQNVTLVFTAVGPAVYAVQSYFDVAAFESIDGSNSTTNDNSTASANTSMSSNATESAVPSSAPISAMSGSSMPSPSPSPSPNASMSAMSMFRAHVATIYAVSDASEVPSVTATTVTSTVTGNFSATATPTPSASAGSGSADPDVDMDSDSQGSNPDPVASAGMSSSDSNGNTSSPTSSGVMQMEEVDVHLPTDASSSAAGTGTAASTSATESAAISTSTATVTVTESAMPSATGSVEASAAASSTPGVEPEAVERMYTPN